MSQTSLYLACGVGSMAAGMVLAWIVSKLAPADRLTDASIRQCGYRFNSYIGFAVVLALYGNTGMALFALLVGVWVPISNAVAVADIAAASQSEGSGIREYTSRTTNPLIIATLAGLFFNVTGAQMPAFTSVFRVTGSASAFTLMAIGSGLRLEDFRKYGKLISLATVERLIAVPAVSFAVGLYFHLTPVRDRASFRSQRCRLQIPVIS